MIEVTRGICVVARDLANQRVKLIHTRHMRELTTAFLGYVSGLNHRKLNVQRLRLCGAGGLSPLRGVRAMSCLPC